MVVVVVGRDGRAHSSPCITHTHTHTQYHRVTGALLGVIALFSGFFTEMIAVVIFTSCYICWRVSGLSPHLTYYSLLSFTIVYCRLLVFIIVC